MRLWPAGDEAQPPRRSTLPWVGAAYLAAFSILAAFAYLFFVEITSHPFGRDFQIYYSGFLEVLEGEDPYLPYSVGGGFVSHPLLLLLMWGLSLAGGGFRAMVIWIGVSAVAYFAAVILTFRILRDRREELDLTRPRAEVLLFILYLALLFAPFHETLYQGQVNAFVLVLLLLFYYCLEDGRPSWSGLFLGGAIVLKTSPVFLLPYLLILRRYRVIATSLVCAAILTILPGIVFGLDLIGQYGYILTRLARAVEPSFYNESLLSIAYQSLEGLAVPDLAEKLIWIHKAVFAIAHMALLVIGFRKGTWNPASRFWLFSTYLVLMTISSPLVWYHHSVFLLLPVIALMLSESLVSHWIALSILLLIQFERFFEDNVVQLGWPVLVAHLLLIGVVALQLARGMRPATVSPAAL